MKPIYIVLLCYLGLIIFWWIWGNLAHAKAVRDKNKRIYQEAEAERLEVIKTCEKHGIPHGVIHVDYEKGTVDFESMKIKKIKP